MVHCGNFMAKAELKTYHGMEMNNFQVIALHCQVAAKINGHEMLMACRNLPALQFIFKKSHIHIY